MVIEKLKTHGETINVIGFGDFLNGKKHGEWRYVPHIVNENYHFYKTISTILEGTYENGKKHGEWIEYTQYNQLRQKTNWVNGRLYGDFFEYTRGVTSLLNPDGIAVKGSFNNGKRDGIWLFWDSFITDITTYKNNKKNGAFAQFFVKQEWITQSKSRNYMSGRIGYYENNKRVRVIENIDMATSHIEFISICFKKHFGKKEFSGFVWK
jgi:antitoxin component YwqK of YwqJK toxin-antitoxin module